jgi:hypothetical protein
MTAGSGLQMLQSWDFNVLKSAFDSCGLVLNQITERLRSTGKITGSMSSKDAWLRSLLWLTQPNSDEQSKMDLDELLKDDPVIKTVRSQVNPSYHLSRISLKEPFFWLESLKTIPLDGIVMSVKAGQLGLKYGKGRKADSQTDESSLHSVSVKVIVLIDYFLLLCFKFLNLEIESNIWKHRCFIHAFRSSKH